MYVSYTDIHFVYIYSNLSYRASNALLCVVDSDDDDEAVGVEKEDGTHWNSSSMQYQQRNTTTQPLGNSMSLVNTPSTVQHGARYGSSSSSRLGVNQQERHTQRYVVFGYFFKS